MSPSDRQVALVTGGSRGIGRAIAVQLARDGFDVALCYRQAAEAAAETAERIRGLGHRVFHGTCDVSELDDVQRFIKAAEEDLGELALAVNCAGIVKDNPLVLMDQGAWKDVLGTNLDGVFNVCRTVVFGFLKRRRGGIVNISSVAGVYGNATQTNYCAAKAGIIGFSKALAKEVGPYGVRVNVVAPGFITTQMTEGLGPKVAERLMPSIALRRLGEAAEVADLVSFLASNRAAYITGQVIQVDGGITL